jgi:hypothetical protein
MRDLRGHGASVPPDVNAYPTFVGGTGIDPIVHAVRDELIAHGRARPTPQRLTGSQLPGAVPM